MAVSWRHHLAHTAPVPFFAAIGRNGREGVEDLATDPGLEWVSSPRHAGLLVVAGEVDAHQRESLQRVHDQLPHPRATLCWGAGERHGLSPTANLPASEDVVGTLHALYRRLLAGDQPSEPDRLADEPPAPWRGLGDHGQGGEGMMGGVPYGRPMPMPPQVDLRDGLALDAYTATFGPFLPPLPPGLALELTLQGDVLQSARVVSPPLAPSEAVAKPFGRALQGAGSVTVLERLRAGQHLRSVARVLAIQQLAPWAERCRRAARAIEQGGAVDLAALRRALMRAGALAAIPAGLGRLAPPDAAALGGVAARAAGHAVDGRTGHPAYGDGGFQVIVQTDGDARARVRQWLQEAEQALSLARDGASNDTIARHEAIETPWGPLSNDPPAAVTGSFTDQLVELEWHEAMLALASFDTAALRRLLPAEPPEDNDGGTQ